MVRIFVRDGDRLTCDIRPAPGGFDLIWMQDGEHHIEHFAQESQAQARSSSVEEDLMYAGWSEVHANAPIAPADSSNERRRRPCLPASDDGSAR